MAIFSLKGHTLGSCHLCSLKISWHFWQEFGGWTSCPGSYSGLHWPKSSVSNYILHALIPPAISIGVSIVLHAWSWNVAWCCCVIKLLRRSVPEVGKMMLASHFVKHFLRMNVQNKRKRLLLFIWDILMARFSGWLSFFLTLKQGLFETQHMMKEV